MTEFPPPAGPVVVQVGELAVTSTVVHTINSLLFLLAKENVRRGTAQVTVTNGALQYVARIPIRTEADLQQVHQQVNYARSLAAL